MEGQYQATDAPSLVRRTGISLSRPFWIMPCDGAVGTPALSTEGYYPENAKLPGCLEGHRKISSLSEAANVYNLRLIPAAAASINKSGYLKTPGEPRTFLLTAT